MLSVRMVLSCKQFAAFTGGVDIFHPCGIPATAPAYSYAGNAATMRPTTWRLRSIPLWPTPPTVTVST